MEAILHRGHGGGMDILLVLQFLVCFFLVVIFSVLMSLWLIYKGNAAFPKYVYALITAGVTFFLFVIIIPLSF